MRLHTARLLLLLGCALVFAPSAKADWTATLSDLWGQTVAGTQDAVNQGQKLMNEWTKGPVTLGVAYGTEKRDWLTWAAAEFAKTPAGKAIKLELIPLGSVEGARAVLAEDKRIHVWSPASSQILGLLDDPWTKNHGKSAIASDAPLVLSPMVVVMWKDRFTAFQAKYPETNFKTLAEALAEPTGWKAIADKAAWGPFTFAITDPSKSNSGLMSLVLMAYDFHGLVRSPTADHVMNDGFLAWLKTLKGNLDAQENSTGNLMTQFLRDGPSQFNGVMTYENLALANFEKGKGRWGEYTVVYPSRSVWNDHPYYILDVPWSSADQRDAAKAFQSFLLSVAAQKKARDEYLFRPASTELPIVGDGSAFDRFQGVMQLDVPTIRRPQGEILELLLKTWERQ